MNLLVAVAKIAFRNIARAKAVGAPLHCGGADENEGDHDKAEPEHEQCQCIWHFRGELECKRQG